MGLLTSLGPKAASYSGDMDWLFWLITIIVGAWFLAAEFMFVWLIFRFRAKDGVPSQYITGKEKHLKRWINIPHTLILLFDIVIITAAIRVWVMIKQTLPPPDSVIRVTAQQWAWTFTDPGPDNKLDTPDDVRTTDEIHLIVNRTYHFELEARDVLHSFYIPAFRLKQDAIPGRIYTGWFKPQLAGNYDLLCAEICGVGHGVMGAKVVVGSAQEHLAWQQQHAADGVLAALNTAAPDTTAASAAQPAGAAGSGSAPAQTH
jgi:cytochrome c oxidase subunit 2